MRNARLIAATALLALLLTSCWPFKKSKKPAPPPAPIPTPAQAQPPPLEPPPATEPKPEAVKLPKPPPPEQVKPVPAPPVTQRPSPAGPPVQPTTPPPAPPPAPTPQLRPILTQQQRQELDRTINARIRRARQTLAALEGRRLSKEQAAAVNQIQTFIGQAEEARKVDLIRASNLAERADVLAQDLIRRVR